MRKGLLLLHSTAFNIRYKAHMCGPESSEVMLCISTQPIIKLLKHVVCITRKGLPSQSNLVKSGSQIHLLLYCLLLLHQANWVAMWTSFVVLPSSLTVIPPHCKVFFYILYMNSTQNVKTFLACIICWKFKTKSWSLKSCMNQVLANI